LGVGKPLYNILFLLHLLSVIAGFGAMLANGAYGLQAKRRGGMEGVAISEASLFVTEKVAQMAIYTVPVWGILLVVTSKKAWKFEQAWVSASLGLYVVLLVLSLAVLVPTHRRINALARQSAGAGRAAPAAEADELSRCEKRLAAVGGIYNLIFVGIVALMIWKPGH